MADLCLRQTNLCLEKTDFSLQKTDFCLGTTDLCLGKTDLCLGKTDLCLGQADLCLGKRDLFLFREDICPVSATDISPVSAADVLGGDENDFDPFFIPKMFKIEFMRKCPRVHGAGGAWGNGGRDVESEPQQQRAMARNRAVAQTPSNYTEPMFL